jgi:hypothetical protein
MQKRTIVLKRFGPKLEFTFMFTIFSYTIFNRPTHFGHQNICFDPFASYRGYKIGI